MWLNNPKTARAGMTLIEILVVVSIVTLLMAVALPAMMGMLGQSEVAKTRAVLNGLTAAAEEYRILTGKIIDPSKPAEYGSYGGETVEVNQTTGGINGSGDNTIGLFLMITMQSEEVRDLADAAAKRQIKPDGWRDRLLNPGNYSAAEQLDINNFYVEDSWGTPIRYAGKVSHSDSFNDDDNLPEFHGPFFASAGPDQKWGSHDNPQGEPDDEAKDNIYSFQTE